MKPRSARSRTRLPAGPLRVLAFMSVAFVAFGPARAGAQEALVLSGGGSRGLAHAGVFLGLEELGYDPDIVVGNSMGAVLGALYAAGYDAEQIRERIAEVAWSACSFPRPPSWARTGPSTTRC